ncbi:vWA domain-containing protein [Anaeromyxobacter paludicola]|uniref:Aerotolerance regulator N-terminal domain-containing protein n=1 Tax=Anaeromyxobacter paludicola TaxID=2918171 RepID=A0ABN6N8R7_9BACT|nr:VWA domain-containing protein [Anaeromyxobacter paludicola]BDG09617.1 hypothetical protein AMPC_27300 [Anaeromyxobacter paludicola]
MSLSFLHPGLAWGLLAAALPLAIHLFFRRRPRPVPFPAIDFILRARQQTERRLKLRKLLLFAARTLLLAAVAGAIARPRLVRDAAAAAAAPRGPSAVAIVLDASASMTYQLGGRTLFERGRALALQALDDLSTEEPATFVWCGGPGAPEAAPPSFDRAGLRRKLAGAEPTLGYSDLSACVGAAARALADPAFAAMGKRIAVATDLTASAWRLDGPPPLVEGPGGAKVRPEVTLLDAADGAPLPNVAVEAIAAEPDAAVGPRGYRITATLANHGGAPVKDAPLQLRVGAGKEERIAIRAFAELPPNGTAKKSLAWSFALGGPAAVTAALAPDALEVDDARALTVSVPHEVRALVVDGAPSPVKYKDESFFLEAALASPASPARPTVVDVEAFSGVGASPAESAGPSSLSRAAGEGRGGGVRLSDYDVLFLLNVRSVGARAAELARWVEAGGGLFIALGDEVDADRYDEELGALLPQKLRLVKTAAERGTPGAEARAARFADLDWTHPALSVFEGQAREGLLGTRTFRYMLLEPARGKGAEPPRVLASYDDGAPALVEARRGKGRVVLYTSTLDRAWSDWTIRTSFLPAMQRFAAYLAGGLEDRPAPPALVLGAHPLQPRGGQKVLAVVRPDGRELPPDRGPDGALTVTPDRPGLWQVKVEEPGAAPRLDPRLAFAVQPDPRESDTRRIDPTELTAWLGGADHAKVTGEKSAAAQRTVPLWSWLLLLGLAAFLAEGALAR